MVEADEIIQQRIELCDTEIEPILKAPLDELVDLTITPKKLDDYIVALGQKTMRLTSEVVEPTLSQYDHYQGRVYGLQMVYKLLTFMRAPKIPFMCDDGDTPYEDYKCGYCGSRVYEDDNYCSECGVTLYFEEEN